VILRAHGISVDLPEGWEGRIFRHRHGDPTLHAATFALPTHDGEFGSRATGVMPPGSAFVTITEYRPGNGLVPGKGLFESTEIPLPLDRRRFRPNTLLVGRRGQSGFQHFFTSGGRPFCLYAVISRGSGPAAASTRHAHVEGLNRVLDSVAIEARH
jgi:hypothetical protein